MTQPPTENDATVAALTETIARLEAVTPREPFRANERRAYWQGLRDALVVVRGQRDALARITSPGETEPSGDGEVEDAPHYGTNATECTHGVSLGEPCEQCEVPPH